MNQSAPRAFLDIFISHASEDRAEVVSPLADALVESGYTVWRSDHEVVPGDDLPLKINEGLRSCRFGVTILSPAYLQKHWTLKELQALTSRGEVEKRNIIIPVLHNLDRAQLTAELPLWAPILSVTWNGNASETAAAIAQAIGEPVTDTKLFQSDAFAIARAMTNGELEIGPRHAALIEGVGQAVSAVTDIWKTVQASNQRLPKNASADRKRATAIMLATSLRTPVTKLHERTQQLEAAASDYAVTLRKLLEAAEVVRNVESSSLIRLNEVYSGVVAATFAQMVSLITDRRAQAVTFPKRHPQLTQVLDRVADDLGHLSYAFETLVDLCVSEMPRRIRRILG